MKSLLFLIPLLGAVALAEEDKCQCPQVKCPGDDAVVCFDYPGCSSILC